MQDRPRRSEVSLGMNEFALGAGTAMTVATLMFGIGVGSGVLAYAELSNGNSSALGFIMAAIAVVNSIAAPFLIPYASARAMVALDEGEGNIDSLSATFWSGVGGCFAVLAATVALVYAQTQDKSGGSGWLGSAAVVMAVGPILAAGLQVGVMHATRKYTSAPRIAAAPLIYKGGAGLALGLAF